MATSLKQRITLIKSFPCFASLSDTQCQHLAEMMEDVDVVEGAIIVTENELIDSVYIIVQGQAEVTHDRSVPVATLSDGEGIGLNDTGFYSTTGKRTATVTALTAMLLLRLDLKDLYLFLKNNQLELAMYAASMQMLRMRFIKQSLPFAQISHERLRWLADHVEEVSVPAGTIIFKQGDAGDKCYLIRKGKVQIDLRDESGSEQELAVLKPPVLFGEATLITHTPRNATAVAIEDCDLLELKHEYLSELIESENNVAAMFMTLMVDRSRPLQNPSVTVHQRTSADGQELTILKNTETNRYFKLSDVGYFIWRQLDGKHTLQDITLKLAEEFDVFAPDVVVALISKLTRESFILQVEMTDVVLEKQALWVRWMVKAQRLLDRRIAFGDADAWVSRVYDKYVRFLFTRPAQWVFAAISVTGFIAFIFSTNQVLHFFSQEHASMLLILLLIPLSMVEVLLHELGHAFAVKAFGREVHYIGLGLTASGPVAFTDTSDMWLAARKPRMLVNLAGVYVDVVVAGLCALLICCVANPYVQSMLWLFALYTYIGGFRMLNPLEDADGYFVLMDWLEKNHLQHKAVMWLIKKFPQCIRHPSLFRENKPEVIYWLTGLFYLFLVTVLTYVVQGFIFIVMGVESNPYLSLILPVLVVIVSSLGIIAEVRSNRE